MRTKDAIPSPRNSTVIRVLYVSNAALRVNAHRRQRCTVHIDGTAHSRKSHVVWNATRRANNRSVYANTRVTVASSTTPRAHNVKWSSTNDTDIYYTQH